MFVVLDTNHYRELTENSIPGQRLRERILDAQPEVFTCIVVVEEVLRGWFAMLNRQKAGRDQTMIYARLQRALETLLRLPMLPFDAEAAEVFHQLRAENPRLGTMDLKIASICMAHEATLLTRNFADFGKVSGLLVENWLD